MAYGDRIAYEPTLAEALNSLFGEGSAEESPGSESSSEGSAGSSQESMSQSEIISNAQEAFSNAQEAAQNGDWAGYGQYLSELENYLNMLGQ